MGAGIGRLGRPEHRGYDDGPEIWVTPSYPNITAPAILAEHIASATHAPVPDVRAALNDSVDAQGAPASFRIT